MWMLLLYIKRFNFMGLPDALVITCIHFLTIGRNLLLISIYISFAFSKIAALSAVCLMDADSVTENQNIFQLLQSLYFVQILRFLYIYYDYHLLLHLIGHPIFTQLAWSVDQSQGGHIHEVDSNMQELGFSQQCC